MNREQLVVAVGRSALVRQAGALLWHEWDGYAWQKIEGELMDTRELTHWMRAVEITLREIAFAISRGKSLDAGAEAFSIIRAGLDDMQEIRGTIENRPIPQ